MSILYTYKNGTFVNINTGEENEDILTSIYVNITNQCPCNCVFCIRKNTQFKEFKDLWLTTEPTVQDVIGEFNKIDLDKTKEIIFCGFGEPLARLYDLLQISKYLKARKSKLKIRINSNGLGDLLNKTDVAPLLADVIDSVSISLNASNAEAYLKVTESIYGIKSYDAIIKFALDCKRYLNEVRVTIVDSIGETEIDNCRAICDKYKLDLIIRKFKD